MSVKQRANFYINRDQLEAVRTIATVEERNISDLVREGIALVIADRMNKPRPDRAVRRENLQAFLARYSGIAPDRTTAEIDDVVFGERAQTRQPPEA
ncbi:MAG TPA: hypothetical protein VHS78_06370 [Candidatus Elarobacter sp.]|jgi:hypothetical protein|nr:hypothetical protein [Candidatus Elarobacter sp.]